MFLPKVFFYVSSCFLFRLVPPHPTSLTLSHRPLRARSKCAWSQFPPPFAVPCTLLEEWLELQAPHQAVARATRDATRVPLSLRKGPQGSLVPLSLWRVAWWLLLPWLPWQQEGLLWPPPGVAALTTSQVQCIEKAGKTPGFAHHLCLATALLRWRTSQARAKPRMETQDLEQQQGAQGALSPRILKKYVQKRSRKCVPPPLQGCRVWPACTPSGTAPLFPVSWSWHFEMLWFLQSCIDAMRIHTAYIVPRFRKYPFYAVLIRMCQVSCLDFVPMILAPVLELDSSSCCFQVLRAFWAAWCCKM